MGGPMADVRPTQSVSNATKMAAEEGSVPFKKRRFTIDHSADQTAPVASAAAVDHTAHQNIKNEKTMRKEFANYCHQATLKRVPSSCNSTNHTSNGDCDSGVPARPTLMYCGENVDVPLNLSQPTKTAEMPLSRLVDRVVERMLKTDDGTGAGDADPLCFWFNDQFESGRAAAAILSANENNNNNNNCNNETSGRSTALHESHDSLAHAVSVEAAEHSRASSSACSPASRDTFEGTSGCSPLKDAHTEDSSAVIHLTIGLSDTIDRVIDNVYKQDRDDSPTSQSKQQHQTHRSPRSCGQRRKQLVQRHTKQVDEKMAVDEEAGAVEKCETLHETGDTACEVSSNCSDRVNSTSFEMVSTSCVGQLSPHTADSQCDDVTSHDNTQSQPGSHSQLSSSNRSGSRDRQIPADKVTERRAKRKQNSAADEVSGDVKTTARRLQRRRKADKLEIVRIEDTCQGDSKCS